MHNKRNTLVSALHQCESGALFINLVTKITLHGIQREWFYLVGWHTHRRIHLEEPYCISSGRICCYTIRAGRRKALRGWSVRSGTVAASSLGTPDTPLELITSIY
jgi:hypothetical protein